MFTIGKEQFKDKKTGQALSNLTDKSNFRNPKNERTNLKKSIDIDTIKKLVEKRERNSEVLSISMWLKIKAVICPNKMTRIEIFYMKLYQRSLEIVCNNMDIINYMKFIHEYIHLKCLLFTDFQSLCFSFIRKPNIYEKNRFLKINSQSHKKLKEIMVLIRDMKEFGDLDKKIFDLQSNDVKGFISNSIL